MFASAALTWTWAWFSSTVNGMCWQPQGRCQAGILLLRQRTSLSAHHRYCNQNSALSIYSPTEHSEGFSHQCVTWTHPSRAESEKLFRTPDPDLVSDVPGLHILLAPGLPAVIYPVTAEPPP